MSFRVLDHVLETSTTTGTSDFTLAGAVTGFVTFASVCATGDTFDYEIAGIDANGNRTAEWEVGLGTYSAANTLARTTPLQSSNGGAAVNFSAGTKQVSMTKAAIRMGHQPVVILSADSIHSATTLSDMGDLNFTAEVSAVYTVDIRGFFRSAATTTGMGVGLNIPSGVVAGNMIHPVTANTSGHVGQNTDDAVSGATTGVVAINTDYSFFWQGVIFIGATGGTVQVRARSEVAASNITFQANDVVMLVNRIR